MAIVTRPDLDALAALLAKARPRASGGIHFSVEGGSDFGLLVPGAPVARDALIATLPSLLAYVRELERERDEALGHAEIWHALSEVRSRESGSGYTHGAVEGALDAARRAAALAMRERCAQRAESAQANGSDCAAAIRALEP